jgi:hypothetical protein
MNAAEITDKLGLHSLRQRTWYIQSTCATSGDGLYEGLEWVNPLLALFVFIFLVSQTNRNFSLFSSLPTSSVEHKRKEKFTTLLFRSLSLSLSLELVPILVANSLSHSLLF